MTSSLLVRVDVDDGDADLLLLHGGDLGVRLVLVVDDLAGQRDEGQHQAGQGGDKHTTCGGRYRSLDGHSGTS